MSKPIPSLGYPSRTAAVTALTAGGKTDLEIADAIGIDEKSVSALRASGKRARKRRESESNGKTIVFPNLILNALRPYADRRGITVNELARRIVETACDEDIVDAILDDLENSQ